MANRSALQTQRGAVFRVVLTRRQLRGGYGSPFKRCWRAPPGCLWTDVAPHGARMPLLEDTMIRAKSRHVALGMGLGLLVAWSAAGCEDEDDLPELSILSPNAGTTHNLGESMRVRFSFKTDDFEIEQDCGAEVQCGMAYLNIDGGACNQPGRDYNNVLL